MAVDAMLTARDMVRAAAAAVGDESRFSKLDVVLPWSDGGGGLCLRCCKVGGSLFVGESNWYVSSMPPSVVSGPVGIGESRGRKLDSTSWRCSRTASSEIESSGILLGSMVAPSR